MTPLKLLRTKLQQTKGQVVVDSTSSPSSGQCANQSKSDLKNAMTGLLCPAILKI
jgi:hypothetical protein